MELKLSFIMQRIVSPNGSNRTFMELKFLVLSLMKRMKILF